MKSATRTVSRISLLAISLLVGCAAALVPYTSDPAEKLKWAEELLYNQGRPIPAERLIRESIDIYKQANRQRELAEAYRIYGAFFRAPAIDRMQSYYTNTGFLDLSAKYESRYSKSIEYFKMADNIYKQLDRPDARSNLYLNMGMTYELAKDLPSACNAYADSLKFNIAARQKDPDMVIKLPAAYKTFEEALAPYQKRAQCE